MKRLKTTIPGFDNLIEGGFPNNSSVLLSGTPGTGKTIFSLQYLVGGALKEKENGVYFSFEEKKDSLIEQAKQFDWDIEKLEKQNKLRIISIGCDNMSLGLVDDMFEIIKDTNAKRVIIDSISTLAFLAASISSTHEVNEFSVKNFLYSFITKFKELKDIQVLFVGQKDEEISDKIAQYICDGVILIEYDSLGGDYSRNVTVKKMRKTKNNDELHPLEISDCGIKIHNL